MSKQKINQQYGQHHNKIQQYSSGEQAILFDKDGCGFCYYKSGRVAICISKVNMYQRRFYAYEDNIRKRLLFSLDEHIHGTATTPDGSKLILTNSGGIVTDEEQNIVETWKWENPLSLPKSPFLLKLNANLVFTFHNRQQATLAFKSDEIILELDCGEKLKRTTNYLKNAVRIKSGPKCGKLLVQLPNKILTIDRQKFEQRSIAKPKSSDMKIDEIRSIMHSLEKKFDTYKGNSTHSALDPCWKSKAKSMTLAQLPCNSSDPSIEKQSIIKKNSQIHLLKNDKDEWLGSVEIRNNLAKKHPVLKRSTGLKNASGRYSIDIPVSGEISYSSGIRLKQINAHEFDAFLSKMLNMLVLVACLREDDRQCRQAEKVCQIVNGKIQNNNDNSFSMIKIEMAESPDFSKRFNVLALPTFLFFYNSKLVNISCLGGEKIRIRPTTRNAELVHLMDHPPFTLIIENKAKQQVQFEKVLKKQKFEWVLALSASQGIKTALNCRDTGLIIIDEQLYIPEIGRWLNQHPATILAVVISTKSLSFSKHMCRMCREAIGLRNSNCNQIPRPMEVCPRCGLISEFKQIFGNKSNHNPFGIYKSLKAATLIRLAEAWNKNRKKNEEVNKLKKMDDDFKGLTDVALYKLMHKSLLDGRRGRFFPYDGKKAMLLSTNETTCLGSNLTTGDS